MDSAIKPFQSQIGQLPLVIMGVAGCGKSSLGWACAQALGWPLIEGDDYHSKENLLKMRSGIPLTDADRQAWLQALAQKLVHAERGIVMTCSALRQRYREHLRSAHSGVRFVYLEVDEETARARVASRPDHIFPPSLVASQFATLEPPIGEPGVLRLDATKPLWQLREAVLRWLGHRLETVE